MGCSSSAAVTNNILWFYLSAINFGQLFSDPISPSIREKFLQTIDNFNLRALGNFTKFLN